MIADKKGWTPKKHLRGWTPEYGWTPKKGYKVKRNVPVRKGKTREHDPIIAESLRRRRALLEVEEAHLPKDRVTVKRLELALATLAYFMSLDGPVYAPLFERLERELETLRAREATVTRAKRLLETYGGQPPLAAIAPPLLALAPPREDEPGVHSTAPQLMSDPQQ